MGKIRIIVADDNTKMLAQLVSVLASDFAILGTAADGTSALDLIRQQKPDVAVLDLRMPAPDGLEVIARLAECPRRPAIVVCSVEKDTEIVNAVLKAGAAGYVFKGSIETDLIPAVYFAARGTKFVSPVSRLTDP